MIKKITFSGIAISTITVLVGGYCIINQQPNIRERYEEGILQKAQTIEKQLNISKSDLKSPDKPDMAAFQEYIMTADPATGEVPTDRLLHAYEQTRALQTEQLTGRNTNIVMDWEGTGANMGGRTRAIMFDPNDPNNKKVWAGGVTGGLWYTDDITNTNENWIPIGDFWSNLAISCIAYDPNNTQTFYVGTGEAQTARIIYRASSGIGDGIYYTNDGGTTWEQMGSTDNFDYITDIAVRDENGTSVIYACVASGTYMGEDHQSEPSDGVFRSDDGGDTWEQVLPIIPETLTNQPYTPADIEISSNGRIFVGTMENLDKQGGATVLYSDSGLTGSWTNYDHYNDLISNESYYKIPARTLVASSPSDPGVIYAQFAAGYTNGFVYYRGRYMAKSTDGGSSWSQINIPSTDWSTLAWHAFALEVDPYNPDIVYTGGLDLWKSLNGGANWNRISNWALMYYGGGDDYAHADQHTVQFQPGSGTTAIFSTDGGIFLTNTANYSYPVFIERNQGYNTLQFYSCCIKPTPFSQQFIGGLQDNGTLLHTGQPLDINDMIDGGDGAYCFWDQDQANIYITSVYYNSYTSWSNGSQADNFGGNSGTFISPADYDYKENILYSNAVDFFGGNSNRLLRASNIPFDVNTQLINLGTGTFVPFSHVSYSRFSPVGTSTLFVGTQSGSLYKVTNAQSEPETIEIGSSDFPTANISCIAIGNSEDNLLVTFSNYGVSSVWLTNDGGATWGEKETNLPDMPIRWAIFHPDNNGQAILATEIGVWWTNTLNEVMTEWAPSVDGMANVRVDMLKLRYGDDIVLAATHGRGLFTAEYLEDIYVGFEDHQTFESKFNIYPNPTVDNITISSNSTINGTVIINITDLNGKTVYTDRLENKSGNIVYKLSLPELTAGTYLVNFSYGGRSESNKLIVK
ncbi:MAG: T9SS type A sorting domain-containing protein [Bacteroidetes bacterium]|nr:T9SS type A sorting domain-containing protein [Bacteroidota bacterium]MBL6944688.1 T9SS type A sorting domain-containing protein [Bacteroidales bacterium]